jgi:hypothetical protein
MRLKVFAVSALAVSSVALFVASPAGAAAVHHPKVSVAANHTSIHLGSTVSMTGAVSPNEHGHRVYLQLYYSKHWHNRSSTLLSKTSHYKLGSKPSHTGTYKYRIYDVSARGWAAAASRTVTVKVTHKPSSAPPATSCYPLTNGGNCYEPGEYCRNSDHGVSGVAGNGEAIKCEDNNGWRWEPR